MRERPEPACSVPDLAHLQQAFLRRKVASRAGADRKLSAARGKAATSRALKVAC